MFSIGGIVVCCLLFVVLRVRKPTKIPLVWRIELELELE